MEKINLVLFFSNIKGLNTLTYLDKKKIFCIKKVFLGKRHLNKKIVQNLNKKKFSIIDNIKSKKLFNEVEKLNPDFIIIAGFHYFFQKNLIDVPKYCTINLHSGRVPNYRGGSPLNWQVINNEKYFYLSALKVDQGIDTGKLIVEKKFKIKADFDVADLHKIANKEFPKIAEKSILNIYKGSEKLIDQKSIRLKSRLLRQRKPEDGKIDWKKNSNIQVYNLIRGITKPYPGAFSFNKKNKIIIFKSKILKIKLSKKKAGEVIFFGKKILIKCKKGYIQVLNYQGKLKNKDILG